MLFLIAQIERFGTLNTMQKTAALYTSLFLKKSGKLLKNSKKKTKKKCYKKGQFLAVFLDFFKNSALWRAVVFCVAFSVPKRSIKAIKIH